MKTNSSVKLKIKTDKGIINKKFTIRKGQLSSSFNISIPDETIKKPLILYFSNKLKKFTKLLGLSLITIV